MEASDDLEIWRLVKAERLVIISKDEGFTRLADRDAEASAQVVWVRMGNCRKSALVATFDAVIPDLRRLITEGEKVIEIR